MGLRVTKNGIFFLYFFLLPGLGEIEGQRGFKEVKGEEGEGLNGITQGTKPVDRELPLSP